MLVVNIHVYIVACCMHVVRIHVFLQITMPFEIEAFSLKNFELSLSSVSGLGVTELTSMRGSFPICVSLSRKFT